MQSRVHHRETGKGDAPAMGLPALFPTNPAVAETIRDLQGQSGTYVYAGALPRKERREIERQARRDARAQVAGIRSDGLAWGPYVTELRCRCALDINLNIQAFYARTLPYVVKIISLARILDEVAPRQDADARKAGASDTWERQSARADRSAAERRRAGLDAARSDLAGYLTSYRTALLELERTADGCRSSYLDRAGVYMNEVLRSRVPRRRLWMRSVRQADEAALVNIHFPEVEVTMPEDIFFEMSPDDVVKQASSLSLPGAYGASRPDALFGSREDKALGRFERRGGER